MTPRSLRYLGALVRTHGIRGGLILQWAPDAPPVRLQSGERIYIGYSAESAQPFAIQAVRQLPRGVLLHIEHITTLSQAEQFVEQGVFVEEDRVLQELPSTEESWSLEDILGCVVVEEDTGRQLGTVVDIWLLPANDVWVVELETAYLPLPVIPDVVRRVDPHQRLIWVRLIPGLLDIAEPKRSHEHFFLPEDGIDAD